MYVHRTEKCSRSFNVGCLVSHLVGLLFSRRRSLIILLFLLAIGTNDALIHHLPLSSGVSAVLRTELPASRIHRPCPADTSPVFCHAIPCYVNLASAWSLSLYRSTACRGPLASRVSDQFELGISHLHPVNIPTCEWQRAGRGRAS